MKRPSMKVTWNVILRPMTTILFVSKSIRTKTAALRRMSKYCEQNYPVLSHPFELVFLSRKFDQERFAVLAFVMPVVRAKMPRRVQANVIEFGFPSVNRHREKLLSKSSVSLYRSVYEVLRHSTNGII